MTRADPIRAALERLIAALGDYEPIWGGFPESALAAARAALDEQQGEGPNDKELNTLWNCSGIADEHGNHTGNIFEFARAVSSKRVSLGLGVTAVGELPSSFTNTADPSNPA